MGENGRPSKLTPDLRVSLLNAIMVGLSVEKACAYVKIHKQSYYNWINQGRIDDEQNNDSIYREFFDSLRNAEEKAEIKLLVDLQKEEDWRAKAWLLERRFRRDWARTEKVEVTGKDGRPVAHVTYDFEKIPRDKLRGIIETLKTIQETQEPEGGEGETNA